MSTTSPVVLTWSANLSAVAAPESRATKLTGDKILLPQSALEQLLAAAPVISSDPSSSQYTTAFDPFNPYTFAAERQARTLYQDRQPQLPQPLTFRLVNPQTGAVIYAGIREFSAEDGTVVLSDFLRERLGYPTQSSHGEDTHMSDGVPDHAEKEKLQTLAVSFKELHKGTYVKLRPLEAGYDPEDWKALLEQHLRTTFTTLTNREEIVVPVTNNKGKKEEFRFLVDGFQPAEDAVCIVDTDLEVDIEALDEEQARETLKRIAAKAHKAPGTAEGSSPGGNLPYTEAINGQVLDGEYVDYDLSSWNRSQGLEFELSAVDEEVELEFFLSPFSTRQRARPRDDQYVFAPESSLGYPKRLVIPPTTIELEGAEALWISVRSYPADYMEGSKPRQYSLRAGPTASTAQTNGSVDTRPEPAEDGPHDPDEVQCQNCQRWVSKGSLFLHENFCLRNNIRCPKGCGQVFKRRSVEEKNHWHCQHDSSYGNSKISHARHDNLYHVPATCPSCSLSFPTLPELAHHRVTICPAKLILCQFCHLEVAQEGDPTQPPDAEVLISGLTPHEIADGSRTTECHLCNKIVRLRDMAVHLKHHDLERGSRPTPRICRNVLCGRTQDGVNKLGDTRAGTKHGQGPGNDVGLCSICFAPLYVKMQDPEGKAMRRRVERRYLTQLMTGCGKAWCKNQFCRTGKKNSTGEDKAVNMKEGIPLVKPYLEGLKGGDWDTPLHFCVDEGSQKRRNLAQMVAAEPGLDGKGGYAETWCVAAFEAEEGQLDRAREWLKNWAPKRSEE